jgi:hypothetical protein
MDLFFILIRLEDTKALLVVALRLFIILAITPCMPVKSELVRWLIR